MAEFVNSSQPGKDAVPTRENPAHRLYVRSLIHKASGSASIQPFADVNKCVSRMAANIPFIRTNLSPLSFTDLPRDLYTQAVLGVDWRAPFGGDWRCRPVAEHSRVVMFLRAPH
jgi:hypothetical protein